MKIAVSALASAVLFAALSPQASAIERLDLTNATGACQGALPSFEGSLRKRPSGIINISTTNSSFVSCSTTQNFFAPSGTAAVLGVTLTNPTAAPVSVSCTMVAGLNYVGFQSPMQYPKTFTVAAGETVEGTWDFEEDNFGDEFPGSLNVSCNLPAGTELGAVYVLTLEDGTAPVAAPPAP